MRPVTPGSGTVWLPAAALAKGDGCALTDGNQRSAHARLGGLPLLPPAHGSSPGLVEGGDPFAIRLDAEPLGPGVVAGVEQLSPDQVPDEGVGECAVLEAD